MTYTRVYTVSQPVVCSALYLTLNTIYKQMGRVLNQPALIYQSFIYRSHYVIVGPILLILVYNKRTELLHFRGVIFLKIIQGHVFYSFIGGKCLSNLVSLEAPQHDPDAQGTILSVPEQQQQQQQQNSILTKIDCIIVYV